MNLYLVKASTESDGEYVLAHTIADAVVKWKYNQDVMEEMSARHREVEEPDQVTLIQDYIIGVPDDML